MDLFFLAAHVPLTKTFSLQGKSPYPMVKNFTSIRSEAGNINEMFLAISTNARAGHCLLKGPLTRPLVNESRAGATRADDTTAWVCLDFDRHEAANIDEELNKLNLGDVSYVLQYSASHGMDGTEGTISAHVFMFLEKPLPAPSLKNWLMGLNFTHFKDGIHMSRDHNQLVFPLDVTTCQNDKLLYIATPRFLDVEDPMGTQPRISLVEKSLGEIPAERVSELHGNVLDKTKRTVLNALRVAYGLPARTAKTSFVGAIEIHNKPDQGTVTGIKEDEDWIRLNVNGGDSWAYVHPKENFELVYDHKSGAWYKTKEFLPGYYATLQTQREELNSTPTEDGDLILAFRDLKTAEYYNGLWNPAIKSLELYRAKNETQLDHWMQSHGRTLGAYIPIWDIQYNPREDWIVDADKHRINTFVPSEYMATPGNAKAKFPKIMAIIKHMLGEHSQDHEISDHFLNWMAVIFQRKAKPLTAWVVHGTEGCLAGDTILQYNRGARNGSREITIKEAYEKWNGLWKSTGRNGKNWEPSITTRLLSVRDELTVGPHEVFRIVETGVKKLYKLTDHEGNTIRVSHEHPFMRPDGTFTKLCDLQSGDVILRRGEKNAHNLYPIGRNKRRTTIHSIPHHPHAWQHIIAGKNYKRSHKARLVWEADMNGLTLPEFVHILRHDPKSAMMMQYLDPSIVVHHLDENCANDDLANLAIVEKLNHDQHHAATTGLGTVPTVESHIISIEPDGEEMTYDVTMKAPYHNYIANGFVVSNTGKGYFINKIAMPLLGHRNATAVISATIEDQFNGWLEGKLLVYVDEVDVDDFKDKGRVTAKLRNYITEPTMPLRRMRQQSIDVPNYVAFIFSSNRPQPVFIPAGDRRYNVGNFQVSKLDRPNDDEIKAELEAFAAWLNAHEADVPRSNTVLQTDARTLIQKLSLTSIVETCESIKNGDFEALWMARMDERLLQSAPVTQHTTNAATYDLLLKRLIAEGYPEVLTRDEMQIILQYNVGNMPTSPNKFTALLRHNGIETKWVRKHGQKTYGIHVKWVKLKKEDLK